jgi:hypothetical protein
MAATPASNQPARQPPVTYPARLDVYGALANQNELIGRMNSFGDLNEKQRVAYAQDSIAHGLMLHRDSKLNITPQQQAKINECLHKLGTKELTDLKLAEIKNFSRDLGQHVQAQRDANGTGGGKEVDWKQRIRDFLMQMLEDDEETRKRKNGVEAMI